MRMKFFFAVLFTTASLAFGAEKAPPEIKPDIFRFVRIEKETFPPVVRKGRTVSPGNTITYGVFTFRYSYPKALEFWGFAPPKGKKFEPRFTQYRIYKKSGWEPIPVGYCGTGMANYTLQPGVDYELLITLSMPGLSDASQLRVSADSPDGTFWSEPFPYPKKLKLR